MTEDQATSLREKLLAHRARLLDHAVQQVDADPPEWGWIRMLGDVQLAQIGSVLSLRRLVTFRAVFLDSDREDFEFDPNP